MPPATSPGCVAIAIRRPADRVWSVAELASRGIFRRAKPAGEMLDVVEQELLALLKANDFEAFMRLAVAAARTLWFLGRPAPVKPPGLKH